MFENIILIFLVIFTQWIVSTGFFFGNEEVKVKLAVNVRETKYVEVRHHWAMIANQHIMIGINSYEKVKTAKYIVSLLTNQNSYHKEIK